MIARFVIIIRRIIYFTWRAGPRSLALRSEEEPKRLSYRDGECELAPAGLVHVVENLSETPFRNVVVELLPAAGTLRRGADPKLIRGEVKIVPHFEDDRAAVFLVHLSSNAEVEVCGPALMATPYGGVLNPEGSGKITVKANTVSDLAWVATGELATLRGSAPAARKIVVFKIGPKNDEESGTLPLLTTAEESASPRR